MIPPRVFEWVSTPLSRGHALPPGALDVALPPLSFSVTTIYSDSITRLEFRS